MRITEPETGRRTKSCEKNWSRYNKICPRYETIRTASTNQVILMLRREQISLTFMGQTTLITRSDVINTTVIGDSFLK